MRLLALLVLLAGCGGMAGQLDDARAALTKAEPYVLTGCDLSAREGSGLQCKELVTAYDELLKVVNAGPQCIALPTHLLQAYERLVEVMPERSP